MLIFGAGEFAKVIQYYTGLSMVVHRQYAKGPVEIFEELSPTQLLICIGDNRSRHAVLQEAQDKGHRIMSWSHPSIWQERIVKRANTFIFEGNNLQPFSDIGYNTVLWSGNHIGHHSRIGNHCFITSHVCIGGGAEIGDYCFIGMNATVFDHVKIGNNCIIAAGAVVDRDIPDGHTLSRKGVLVKHEMAQA